MIQLAYDEVPRIPLVAADHGRGDAEGRDGLHVLVPPAARLPPALQGLRRWAMDHGAYVDAAAATLGLKISAEQRPGVLQYFALAAGMAELVKGLPLPPHDESGNVFLPVRAAGRHAHDRRRRRRASRPRCARRAQRAAAVQHALARIEATDARVNAFTGGAAPSARCEARDAVDAQRARAQTLPPLAGVPYAVKNLFDVAGPDDAGRLEDRRATRAPAAARRRAGAAPARRPARCWSARSTWTSTPTASPPRTRTTGRRAIRTTWRASPAARRAARARRWRRARCR